MKWTTPLFLVLILGALGFVARITLFGTPESPQQVLDAVRDRVRLGNYDERRELKAISSALKHPGAREDADLTGDLLRVRADIYRQQERFDKARSDVERIQALTAEEELPLELEAIELQALEGQPEEALRRIEVLAFHHPESADVAQLRGRLETLRGETLRAEALRLAEEQLVDEDTRKATPLIIELCSQHARDPRRTRVQRELRELFPRSRSASLESILDACDLASEHLAQARLAYARGLEQRLTIPALRSLLDLLVEAHRPDLVVDLGVASRVFPEVMTDPANLVVLADAMQELGQKERIARIVASWPWAESKADAEFYRRTARVLYEAQRLGPLGKPANELRNFSSADLADSDFYLGYIASRGNAFQHALTVMDRFLRSKQPGPVAGARSIAYREIASAWRALGDPAKELRALKGVISERGEILAEDYLHLAESERSSPNALPALIEENWTKGMSMAPERTAELMPLWEELGNTTFGTYGVSFDQYYQSLVNQQRAISTQRIGPYTQWRIGMRHLEQKRYHSALVTANFLLNRYPGLLPAFDLRIQAALLGKDTSPAGPQAILKRLRLVGSDETSEQYLRKVGLDRFTEEELLELVRLSPYGVGRTSIADHLMSKGRFGEALQVMRPIPEHPDPTPMHLKRVKCLVELGRYEEAVHEASIWLEDPEIGPSCRRLVLRAHMMQGDAAGVAAQTRALTGIPVFNPGELRELAKDLLVRGFPPRARPYSN
ncbi:MAG: hypothetical protein R3F17_13850 [Planctomycetota bacterium]